MKGLAYRGYTIRSISRPMAGGQKWEADTIILKGSGKSAAQRIFPSLGRFPTQDAAVRASLALGMRIIDGKVPGISLSA